MKIGAITIGQAPRVDVTADIMDIFGGNIELFQRGGLDGLTREEIETFKPEEGASVSIARCTVPYFFRSLTTLFMMVVGMAKP